jgi:hypothetical protein
MGGPKDGPENGPGWTRTAIITTFMIQINKDYFVALKFYKVLIFNKKAPTSFDVSA